MHTITNKQHSYAQLNITQPLSTSLLNQHTTDLPFLTHHPNFFINVLTSSLSHPQMLTLSNAYKIRRLALIGYCHPVTAK